MFPIAPSKEIIYTTKQMRKSPIFFNNNINININHPDPNQHIIPKSLHHNPFIKPKFQSHQNTDMSQKSAGSRLRTSNKRIIYEMNNELIQNQNSEINRLLFQNNHLRHENFDHRRSKYIIQNENDKYYPFTRFPSESNDYEVLFSFRFIDENYLFVRRIDKRLAEFYYWINEVDVVRNKVCFSDVALPGIYFKSYENFIEYSEMKGLLDSCKMKLFEYERKLGYRIEDEEWRIERVVELEVDNKEIKGGKGSSEDRYIKSIGNISSVKEESKEEQCKYNEEEAYLKEEYKVDDSNKNQSQEDSIENNKPEENQSLSFRDHITFKAEQLPINIKEIAKASLTIINDDDYTIHPRVNTINTNELHNKLSQVILTYKHKLLEQESHLKAHYTSIISNKDLIITSLQKDIKILELEATHLTNLISNLKLLLQSKDKESTQLLYQESLISQLKSKLTSLTQSNQTLKLDLNAKSSEVRIANQHHTSLLQKLQEKNIQLTEYSNLLLKLSSEGNTNNNNNKDNENNEDNDNDDLSNQIKNIFNMDQEH